MSVAVMLLLGGLVGCTRTIGDGCIQNVDCSIAGDRFCDIASPGGYCTVEGCDYNTCPDNSACVRFFDLLRGAPGCHPCKANPAITCPTDAAGCRPGEQCMCADQACASAYCASETSERRWCMHPCKGDGDCRDGYRCYMTGANGAVIVPQPGVASPPAIQFCAPAPQT